MAADMWRVPASKVHKVGTLSFVQDSGVMTHAATASNGNYLFSEVGAGTKPLALIGMWHEVINFLAQRPTAAIENRILDLPDIYMGACFYRPGERFKGLFPIHDTIQQLTEGLAAMTPGNTVTDVGGLIGEGVSAIHKQVKTRQRPPAISMASTPVVVTFTYLPAKDVELIGTGTADFQTLQPIVTRVLSAFSGV
ncbi:hypothetical protein [Parazoarcus communis]|uniref:Uncharacterized protein n=1 Tax=Parazoarcus communis SWub3 = DSM 12120 TaxID=1121029 RepID=A0A323URZ5_9RHOO|nr:hypothetical protein [Parazoarcus communis]NMG71647.1 hypothetical protein [Parazoarcus communis SWub3 = DSM 12120]PZA15304.1 hypothetical protein DNK49_17280 [Azoarcus communis] [Parazoarcus communis SWub3 = DSM 12120]